VPADRGSLLLFITAAREVTVLPTINAPHLVVVLIEESKVKAGEARVKGKRRCVEDQSLSFSPGIQNTNRKSADAAIMYLCVRWYVPTEEEDDYESRHVWRR
jgi:hypothetical protein